MQLKTAKLQLQFKESKTTLSEGGSLIIKKRESAPKVLQEKENALKEAQNQLSSKQKDYSDFKQKVDQQKTKADTLLQQYLQALPK